MNCMIIQDWQWKHHYLFLKKQQQAVNELTLNVIEECAAIKTLWNHRTVRYLLMIQQNLKKSEAELLIIMNEWLWIIIEEFQSVFKLTLSDKLSSKWMFKHSINISDVKSVNINAYFLSQLQLNKQAKQIMKLMNKDLICEFTSSWSFLVLFVKKKKNTWWMCIDYRALNNITVKNEYSLSWIQKYLDQIDKAWYLIKLNLTLSYYQVCVIKDNTKKTVFNIHYSKYKFTAMFFKLYNASVTFQSMMNSILQNLLNKFCLIYLNNILIFFNSISDHQKHL